MKVIYVLRMFPVLSETFVLREIQELRRQGVDLTICALAQPDPDEPWHPGVAELVRVTVFATDPQVDRRPWPVAVLAALLARPGPLLRMLPAALSLCCAERGAEPLRLAALAAQLSRRLPAADHVHAHFAHAPATVALLLATCRAVPFSFTAHARDIFVLTPTRALSRKVARARFVVTVTGQTQVLVRAATAAGHRPKVALVRNGVPAPGPAGGPPPGPPLVLSVARLVEKKGGATLLRACAELVRRGVRFRCELVGDGPLRGALERVVSDLRLDGTVSLRGPLTQAEVSRAYSAATVFALPCQIAADGDRDAFPVALLEAMSHGVPVVTTPVAGIAELIRHGNTGLLVPPGAPAPLADAVHRLLTEPDLHARLAAGGRRVASQADLAASVRRLRELFASGAG